MFSISLSLLEIDYKLILSIEGKVTALLAGILFEPDFENKLSLLDGD